MNAEQSSPGVNSPRIGSITLILVVSALIVFVCLTDLLYLNPFWSLFAQIPLIAYGGAAMMGALFGWFLVRRADRTRRVAAMFGALAVSLAAVAILIAWVPRLDQWTSPKLAVAYQFTNDSVYRRVQPPHDLRRPDYFMLEAHDVAAYDQFLVMVIDGKLGTYVNFNTLIPLGKR
jgi:Na+/proline symporter